MTGHRGTGAVSVQWQHYCYAFNSSWLQGRLKATIKSRKFKIIISGVLKPVHSTWKHLSWDGCCLNSLNINPSPHSCMTTTAGNVPEHFWDSLHVWKTAMPGIIGWCDPKLVRSRYRSIHLPEDWFQMCWPPLPVIALPSITANINGHCLSTAGTVQLLPKIARTVSVLFPQATLWWPADTQTSC